jgi:hypothetical protein
MAERQEHQPGTPAPLTDYYRELNVFGTPTGRVEHVPEGGAPTTRTARLLLATGRSGSPLPVCQAHDPQPSMIRLGRPPPVRADHTRGGEIGPAARTDCFSQVWRILGQGVGALTRPTHLVCCQTSTGSPRPANRQAAAIASRSERRSSE